MIFDNFQDLIVEQSTEMISFNLPIQGVNLKKFGIN